MIPLKNYLETPLEGRKYIAHCYEDMERKDLYTELNEAANKDENITVLIGPEGDFAIDEVEMAIEMVLINSSSITTSSSDAFMTTAEVDALFS